jgi:CHC2 zinc finger
MTGTVETYLLALFGAEPDCSYVELRGRRPEGGMEQAFYPVREVEAAAAAIRSAGRRTDLYIGVAPRCRREGTREAVERVHVLWADLDEPEAIEALRPFRPAPSIVVASGSGLHAYWSLWPPIGPEEAERANRRLAHRLGADPRATDVARILRPPESFNHQGSEPRPVRAVKLEAEVFAVGEVVGELADPPGPERRPSGPRPIGDEPLLSIPAPVYVEALAGLIPGRDGKVACPFHEDRTPSLHVYEGDGGWYCFGCGRGGSVIDFAAELFGIEPRGEGFRQLRERIAARLLSAEVAA